MALSGTVNTSTYDGVGLQLTWTATQSVANNTSTISWTLKSFGGSSTDSWFEAGPVTLKIAGATEWSTTSRFNLYKAGGWSRSGTTDPIPHASDGSKTINISIEAAIYTFAVNCTASQNVTLDKIARNPGAPTTVTATAGNGEYVSFGDTITIRWSGASGVITNYQRAYRWYTNGAWTSWGHQSGVPGTSTSGSNTVQLVDTSVISGDKIQFRVRACNGELYSSWVTSNPLTIVGGMSIKVSGAWKKGTTYVKVSGAWKRAKHVYIKVNGSWKESI